MLKIRIINVKEGLSEELYESYMRLLPAARQERIGKFMRREDAVRSLIPDLYLRLLIYTEKKIPLSEIHFETNKYGKPALPGCPEFAFNISHSGDWTALATDSCEVGVDVEREKEIDMDIAKRFFSPREYEDLMAQPASGRLSYFFDLWTLKESFIKAVGKGLSHPLDKFAMVFEGEAVRIIKEDPENWFFRQYPMKDGYKLAACAKHDNFPQKVERLDLDDVYAFYKETILP